MKRNFKGNHSQKMVDFSKAILYQGKLNIQKKNKKFEPKLFQIIDKKLIFFRVNFLFFLCITSILKANKEETPKGYYDLLEFFKISQNVYEENSKPALYSFCLQKYGKISEFFSSKKEKIQAWIDLLKLYCISDNFKEFYHCENVLGKGHFAEVFIIFLNSFEKINYF